LGAIELSPARASLFTDSYYEGPIADAPLVHKIRPVTQYVFEVLAECRRSLAAGAEIPAALTSLAVVDYLAGFYAGRETQRSDYEDFLWRFFPEYRPFTGRIYQDLRCGLLHNLVTVNPWRGDGQETVLLTKDSADHLNVTDGKLVWSIRTFIEHIGRALLIYQHHLIMNTENAESVRRFHARFNRLGGAGASMEKLRD
jgi:hypothetical protein